MKKRGLMALMTAAMLALTACSGGGGAAAPAASTAASTGAASAEASTAGAESSTTTAAPQATEAVEEYNIDALKALAAEGMETSIDAEPVELSFGCSGTVEGTVMGDAIAAGIEAVSEWTGGNVKVNFFPGGQLGGDAEMISGMQMGSVDMYTGAPTSQVTVIPELAIMDIGGLFADADAANTVLNNMKDQLNSFYEGAGLRLEQIYVTNFRILTSNKPVTSAADLQGLNIRTQENEYHMAFWKQLGTNPTPLAFGELYIALQQGMMDAQENPWGSIVGPKLYEVQKYIVKTNHIPFVQTIVISKAKYDSLSDAQKLAIDQFTQYVNRFQLAGTAADDARLEQVCKDYGCEVSDVSSEITDLYPEATQVVVDMMKQKVDPALVDAYVEAAEAAR